MNREINPDYFEHAVDIIMEAEENKRAEISGKVVINFSDLEELINAKIDLRDIRSSIPSNELQQKVQVARELCRLFDKQTETDVDYCRKEDKRIQEIVRERGEQLCLKNM